MHFLYVFILQSFWNSTGVRKFTVSADPYETFKRAQLLSRTVGSKNAVE